MESKSKTKGKIFVGKVVSNRDKCVIVLVERFVKHPKYGKFIRKSKRYKAHDEAGTREIGSLVSIAECRPLSKDKHFRVLTSLKNLS